ncbi:MAG: tetratricopeptide repeat protein, partial [Lentisphaeria bacterium]|nr:tetratricopeptide repeat protein [Lentisphaeria bacterium]
MTEEIKDNAPEKPCIMVVSAIFLVAFLFYCKSISFEFLNWDDDPLITNNPLTKSFSLSNIFQLFIPGSIKEEMLYIPLTYLSFAIENIFSGPNAKLTHAINCLLHACNAVLLFLFLDKLKIKNYLAIAAVLIFILHPIVPETVCWGMGRKDLLSTAFALMTLMSYNCYLNSDKKLSLILTFVFFLLASLSKPSLIILPGLLVALHFYIKGFQKDKLLTKNHLIQAGCFAGLMILIFCLNMNENGQENLLVKPDAGLRILAIPYMITNWILRFTLIKPVNPFYMWPPLNMNTLLPYCLGPLLIVLSIFMLYKKKQMQALLFLSLTLLSFVPAVLVVIQYRNFISADRYGYFPLCFISVAVLIIADQLVSKKEIIIGLSSLVIIFCAVKSWQQSAVWKDSISLWEATLEMSPDNPFARQNLGAQYMNEDTQKGINLLKEGLTKTPDNFYAFQSLGAAYQEIGEHKKSIPIYLKGIQVKDDYAGLWINLGIAYLELRNYDKAEESLIAAYKLDPNNLKVAVSLAAVYENKKQYQKALAQATRATKLDPLSSKAWTRKA